MFIPARSLEYLDLRKICNPQCSIEERQILQFEGKYLIFEKNWGQSQVFKGFPIKKFEIRKNLDFFFPVLVSYLPWKNCTIRA